RMAAVDMTVRNRAALTQCSARSTPSKRRRRAWSARGLVVATIRLPHPTVDVVAPVLPVALLRLAGRDVDGVEPLARLVAVHGGDVHPYRSAVGVRDRLALHRVGDDHVLAPGLQHGQALGVGAVEG